MYVEAMMISLLALKISGYVCVFLGFCLLTWAKVLRHRAMQAQNTPRQYVLIIKQDESV